MPTPPQVVTLALDAAATAFFNALRQRHFPPERNFLAAHLTLFHHLPPGPQTEAVLQDAATAEAPFELAVTGVAGTGRGVAYKVESKHLQQLHKGLQQRFAAVLIPQDAQTLWPHVTVQNKVTPAAAQALLQQLQPAFTPFSVTAQGLCLWNYLGGPWSAAGTFWFEASRTAGSKHKT